MFFTCAALPASAFLVPSLISVSLSAAPTRHGGRIDRPITDRSSFSSPFLFDMRCMGSGFIRSPPVIILLWEG
jgi:hypothetical protein